MNIRACFLLLGSFFYISVVPAQEVIVDNADPGFSVISGNWFLSANAGFFGTNSLITNAGGAEERVRWTGQLPTAGEYGVDAWWVASTNRPSDAPYTISTATTPQLVLADQTTNSAQWNSLGNFVFNAGAATVELSNQSSTGDFVSADAIRWTFIRAVDPGERCVDLETNVLPLGGAGNCAGLNLPGAPVPHPETKWAIHSDLPERFSSNGVLYSTRPILPNDQANSIPLNLRTQTNNGFTTIDDDFDLFVFHITTPGDGSAPRRVVVHVENNGSDPVTINPRQVIITQGIIGNVHEMESNLGRRWMDKEYDDMRPTQVIIPVGGSAPIAWSNNFGGFGAGIDANLNCFGMIRGDIVAPTTNTDLTVNVVAISAGNESNIAADVTPWLNVAATSAETAIDITTEPQPFELRRAIGVFPNFQWISDTVTVDAAALTVQGRTYQMALSEIQSFSCGTGRQTVNMVRYPGFAQGDTIGNYQVDYLVNLHLVNSSETELKAFDLEFQKTNADIGLAWRLATDSSPISLAMLESIDAVTEWAGPNQDDNRTADSLLEPFGGPITLAPCSERYVSVFFTVLGNSSLPFQINVVPATPNPDALLVLDGFKLR